MYRPDNWDELKPQSHYEDWGGESFNRGVEAGADAILKEFIDYLLKKDLAGIVATLHALQIDAEITKVIK